MRKTLFALAALSGVALAMPALAEGITPDTYLSQALRFVQQHRQHQAVAAVDNAENVLLEPPTPYEFHSTRDLPGEPEVIRQFGRAREAIQERRWSDAEYYIRAAMTHPSADLPGTPFYSGQNDMGHPRM